MRIEPRSRRRLRLQGTIFLALFLGAVALLAWLSTRYAWQADWTAAGRSSLSEASIGVLERFEGPVEITAFAREGSALSSRDTIDELVGRYRRQYPDLHLRFVNPDTAPGLTRRLGIEDEGELVIEYQSRSERIGEHTEQALTNALQRLLRGGERRLGFIAGHGERAPGGQANHDLGRWVHGLKDKGIRAEPLHLGRLGTVPEDIDVVVIASPRFELPAAEVELLRSWVDGGGNLLWLLEPDGLQGLEPLADDLGIRRKPGVVIDPTTRQLGLDDPTFALITGYTAHPVTRGMRLMTILPQACALESDGGADWEDTRLLETAPQSWAETGPLQGSISRDAEDEAGGPLTLGFALNRTPPSGDRAAGSQRVALVCDGDFLSNTYLGNQGNRELGDRLVNWLTRDDAFITIAPRPAPDAAVSLSQQTWAWLGLFFLLLLPAGLVGSGTLIWWRRRRR